MLSLNQVLVDFDIIHLRAMARLREIELESNVGQDIADQLTTALLSPETVDQGLRGLTDEERLALETLQLAGGKMRAHIFQHQFGPIRPFGPARLEREEPWLHPVGPAESLWYKGFLGRSFAQEGDETPEFIFIPADLLPLLSPPDMPMPSSADENLETPAIVQSDVNLILSDLFELLLYIQLHHPRAVERVHLGATDVTHLNARLGRPEPVEGIQHDGETERLGFIHHLCRRLGMLEVKAGRIQLTREGARRWLDLPAKEQTRSLLETWKSDDEWNDLWHVPGLRCEPAGWENDPVRARERFLHHLGEVPAGEWYGIAGLIAQMKAADPDFQRPNGDYNSWYIRHARDNNLLLGFEHWEAIEGALIQYYICRPLYWLGAVELGYQDERENGEPQMFRITEIGEQFLHRAEESFPKTDSPPVTVEEDLTVRLHQEATLYYRLQISRFAELLDDANTFRITSRSLLTARTQRIQPAAILNFLEKATGVPISAATREELHHQWHIGNQIHLRRFVTLEFAEPAVVEWVQNDPECKRLLANIRSPTRVELSERHLPRVLARLKQLGIQPDITESPPNKKGDA